MRRSPRERAASLRARYLRPTRRTRHPLIPPEVRAKIEAIEADAGAKGWPAELLWSAGFWDCPRGLAAVLDANDEIAEVTREYIAKASLTSSKVRSVSSGWIVLAESHLTRRLFAGMLEKIAALPAPVG